MGSAPSCGSNVRNIDTHLQRLSSNQRLTEDELNMLTTMLRTKASEAMEIKHKLADDGLYVDSIRKTILLFFINTFSHKFNKVEQRVKFLMEISTILLQTKFINIIRGCLIKLHIRSWVNVDGTVDKSAYDLIRWSMSSVVDLADVSDELSFSLANDKNYMATIKTILEDKSTQHLQSDISPLSDFYSEIIETCLKVVTNISRWSNCAQLLRNHNFTKVIKPYLNSSDELTSLAVLSALAAIVNESECDIINAALDKVQLLLDVLKHGLDEKDRRYRGWSCKECAYTVKMLVRNDANKQLLVELGVLELLVKMGRTGNEEEQCESVNAAWALCFNKDIQQKVAKDESLGLVELLFDLKTSSNSHIRKTCNGALWTLRDVLASSEYQKNRIFAIRIDEEKAESLENKATDTKEDHNRGTIMISYQWGNQKIMKVIKEKLKEKHFKVWMDIDEMEGSTIQAMASAVENAELVLICVSQKYKNSENCRAEAEYAFQLKKAIIPLKMEKGYKPDGWLGLICGAKLFYEFSGKYPFHEKFNELLRALAKNWNRQDLISELSEHPETDRKGTSMDTIDSVRKWTDSELSTWIDKNGLKGVLPSSITTDDIALLLQMRIESADFFYKCAYDMLNISNLSSLSKLAWALQTISMNERL